MNMQAKPCRSAIGHPNQTQPANFDHPGEGRGRRGVKIADDQTIISHQIEA